MNPRLFHPDAIGFDATNARLLADLMQLLAVDDTYAARDALAQWGLPRFVGFGQRQTRAFAAGNDQLLLVAFQGPDDASVLRRLAAPAQPFTTTSLGGVNESLWLEFSLVRDNVLETIQSLRDAGQRIWLTGHGVGGAWAVFTAGLLESERRVPVQGVLTWGTPRVGHREFALRYHRLSIDDAPSLMERTTRIVLGSDPFPVVPPTAGDYAAIGIKRHYDSDGRLLGSDERSLEEMARLVTIANMAAMESDPPELADHTLAAYCGLLAESPDMDAGSHP